MTKVTAFLDSSVVLAALQGRKGLERLFSAPVTSKVRFAVNAVVLQELLLAARQGGVEDRLGEVHQWADVIETSVASTSQATEQARRLRNWAVHSNDLLILGSAKTCDYLLTYDKALTSLASEETVQAATPEDFLRQLEAVQ